MSLEFEITDVSYYYYRFGFNILHSNKLLKKNSNIKSEGSELDTSLCKYPYIFSPEFFITAKVSS